MKYLDLDKQFNPFGKSIEYDSHVFNGGEPHIRITDNLNVNDYVTVTIRIRSFSDMGLLIIAVDALRRMDVKDIDLLLPYFPGARQDRIAVEGEALTVEVYAKIVNDLRFNQVTILDPHSDVTTSLVKNVKVINNAAIVEQALSQLDDFVLVAPDKGSCKRVKTVSEFLGNKEVVHCTKKRNVSDGKLNGFQVNSDNLNNRSCVVIDDICDGGATFLGIGKKLKEHNAGKLILFVTHGIFSKGSDELINLYDEIICTDSFSTLNDPHIRQIELDFKNLNI